MKALFNFHDHQKKGNETLFGDFLSIFTVVGIFLAFWNTGSEIIYKDIPRVLSQTQKASKRPRLEINQYKFSVGIITLCIGTKNRN